MVKAVAYDDTIFAAESCTGAEQASVVIRRSSGDLINGAVYVMFE